MKTYRAYRQTGSQWLDVVPAHWRFGRIEHVATARTSTVDKHSIEGQPRVRLCNYTDVYKNDLIHADIEFMAATAKPEQVESFRLAQGDTVITKDSETADDIGVPAFVEYEAPDLVCGYHLAIVRPDLDAMDARYLYWSLASQPTLRQWAVLASGVTRVGIRGADLSKSRVPVPPLPEQKAIADYLDRETAQIDALIEEQRRLIELFQERRQAAIDRLVWSGVDQSVELGPTGIAAAPHAPMHWTRTRNRAIFHESAEVSETGDEVLLTVSHLTGITPRSEKVVHMTEAESLVGYRVVRPGDLVINTMWAWMGAAGVASMHGIVSPAYGVYRLRNGMGADPRYLNHLYRSRPYIVEMTRHSRGIWESRLRLYPDVFLSLPAVLPPLEEQRRIAAYLDAEVVKVDRLMVEAERFIDLSRERRSALITAAVTGQIDVRDEVA